MRCLVSAVGSRGDIETFVLLGEALAARGWQVRSCFDPAYRDGVTHGEFVPLGELTAADVSAIVARALAEPTPVRRGRSAFGALFVDRRDALRARLTALAGDADLVVVPENLLFPDGDRLPWSTPTAVVVATQNPVEDMRALARLPCLRLAAMSARFAPADPVVADAWSYTGFWLRPGGGALPAEVERFVAAGPPPVFLTMGSMTGFDGAALGAAFVAAARRLGRRSVVQRGWAGLAAPPGDDVLVVDEVDYRGLFARCAALVVHGGAGTVAHALHAGRPTGVLPLLGDQRAWADAMVALGIGAGVADPAAPDPDRLEVLLARALEPDRRARAEIVAADLRREPGLAEAVTRLEAY